MDISVRLRGMTERRLDNELKNQRGPGLCSPLAALWLLSIKRE